MALKGKDVTALSRGKNGAVVKKKIFLKIRISALR